MTGPTFKSGKIFIIDDSIQYLSSLETILRSKGYPNVSGFTRPIEGLAALRRETCDLLILDMQMPEMNGIQILMELEKLGVLEDSFPVLILTGDSDPGLRDTALAIGAMDYLAKPFRMSEVVLRVKNLLRTRMLHLEIKRHAEELETRVRERTEELSGAHIDTVMRLARAAEFRDDDTGKHIVRVGEMAARLSVQMGLNHAFPELVRFAAQLHDIGKIAIPDAILLKPGRLSGEEFTRMKTHTVLGAQILDGSPSYYLKLAGEIAMSHHERWDGSGYPQGLAGGDIPLCGRVTAVADVYDALTHERPYKQAWTHTAALAELRAQRSKMFDPAAVDAFEAVIESEDLPPGIRPE